MVECAVVFNVCFVCKRNKWCCMVSLSLLLIVRVCDCCLMCARFVCGLLCDVVGGCKCAFVLCFCCCFLGVRACVFL